jgi:hypothetical protein
MVNTMSIGNLSLETNKKYHIISNTPDDCNVIITCTNTNTNTNTNTKYQYIASDLPPLIDDSSVKILDEYNNTHFTNVQYMRYKVQEIMADVRKHNGDFILNTDINNNRQRRNNWDRGHHQYNVPDLNMSNNNIFNIDDIDDDNKLINQLSLFDPDGCSLPPSTRSHHNFDYDSPIGHYIIPPTSPIDFETPISSPIAPPLLSRNLLVNPQLSPTPLSPIMYHMEHPDDIDKTERSHAECCMELYTSIMVRIDEQSKVLIDYKTKYELNDHLLLNSLIDDLVVVKHTIGTTHYLKYGVAREYSQGNQTTNNTITELPNIHGCNNTQLLSRNVTSAYISPGRVDLMRTISQPL